MRVYSLHIVLQECTIETDLLKHTQYMYTILNNHYNVHEYTSHSLTKPMFLHTKQ